MAKNISGNQSQRNENYNLLKIKSEAYNFLTKGELTFDLKINNLTQTVKGPKSEDFKKNINIKKNFI